MTRRRPAGRDRGSFTAELAAGLPALLLLLLTGLSAVNAVGTRAGCLHAAREAALAASRGADGAAAVGGAVPEGAEVTVTVDGRQVVATVRAPVRALGSRLPRISVTATAVAAMEPGVAEAGVPGSVAPGGGP
ncbi:TadE family type IV pilus minor pilin [Micromonospora sp. CPCC 205561]|uniref:TadE family type IV pilus minor pilin n=1 Tax=Micromonospora sp. CPCC 205561 TaxID=3122407 RepID=UPI002FF0409B